jgi:dienelactone hydrolase
MREGFAHSTGELAPFHCDLADYARRNARDVKATVDHFLRRGLARAGQVLVAGQSNGGMVSLAYIADYVDARGVLNFSGGIDTDDPACDWRNAMLGAAKTLGASAKAPSLWLYARDDRTFPPYISQPFFDAYREAGASATLALFPAGGHGFSFTTGSSAAWGRAVERFLLQLALPAAATR